MIVNFDRLMRMKSILTFTLATLGLCSYAQRLVGLSDSESFSARFDDDLPASVIWYEGFENAQLPALPKGWTSFGSESGFSTGTAGNAPGQTNANGFWNVPKHGVFAVSNDDVCNCDKSQDRLQLSPLNLSGFQGLVVRFEAYQDGSAGQSAHLEVRSANHFWTTLIAITPSRNWATFTAAIPAQFMESGFQLRFVYDDGGNYASGLAIDDIYIFENQPDIFELTEAFAVAGSLIGSGQGYDNIPLSQARSAQLHFTAHITNSGNKRRNAQLAVQVNGPVTDSDTSKKWLIGANDQAIIGASHRKRFTPYLPGNYTTTYSLLTDSIDGQTNDNFYTSAFTVGDTLYRRTPIPTQNSAGVWLEGTGDRYGSVFHMHHGDTLEAIYVRIHPSTVAGARFRIKVFSADTLTSSSFSSSPIIVSAADIGQSKRIPLNVHISKGKQVIAIEKEAGAERLVIGAYPSISAENGNATVRKAGQTWKPFAYFPLIELVFPEIDTLCGGHILYHVQDESCPDQSDGSISAEVIGANDPVTFNWSNGAGNVSSITDLSPGAYSLFVTDAENCIYNVEIEILAADSLNISPLMTLDSCGKNSGVLDLQISGGQAPYNIHWNGTQGLEREVNLPAGTYAIEIEDANGCTYLESVGLTGTSPLNIVFDISPSDCADSSGSVSVSPIGTAPFSYQWSTGDSVNALSNLASGVYEITVFDSLGCASTGRAFVNDLNGPNPVAASIENVRCYGQATGEITTSVGGGATPYSYMWSNGDSSSTTSLLGPGHYVLTVTDNDGCKGHLAVEIEGIDRPLLVDANDRGNHCFGDSIGVVELVAHGGVPPYSVTWSNGSTSLSITDLTASNYSYTLEDANGCSVQDTIVISSGELFTAQIASITYDTSDNFLDDGAIEVQIVGGTPPIHTLWNDSIVGQNLQQIPPGFYRLVATDQLGCTAHVAYLLENGPSGIAQASETPLISVYPNPTAAGSLLSLTAQETMHSVRLVDFQGRVVMDQAITPHSKSASIRLPAAASGNYFLLIQLLNGVAIERIAVLR
jgi:hypothetical protein